MRFLFYGLLSVVCLLLAGLSFLFVVGPSDLLREQLAESIKQRTGRDLVVGGSASFTVWPDLGIALSDVTLSGPPEMPQSPLVTVARLEIGVPLGGLLRRELGADRLLLKGAIVDLQVAPDGRTNWRFEPTPQPRPPAKRAAVGYPLQLASTDLSAAYGTHADATAKAEQQDDRPAQTVLPFQEIHVVDGTIRFRDEATGRREEILGVQARGKQTGDGRKLDFGGRANWRDEAIEVQGAVASLPGLLSGGSPAGVKLVSRHGELLFEGSVATGPLQQIAGRIKATTPSFRMAAAWMGARLPPGVAIDAVTLGGALSVSPGQAVLRNLAGTVDGSNMRGELTLTAADRSHVRGALVLDKLDLNAAFRLQPSSFPGAAQQSEPQPAGREGSPDRRPRAGASPEEPASRGEPQSRPPQVRGWSSQPFDLGILRMGDADLALDVGRIVYRDLLLERSKVSATLSSGVLKAVIEETSVHRGRGSGTLDIDSVAPVPKLALQATVEGSDAQGLLKAAAGFDRVAGRATIALKVTAAGRTQQDLTDTVTGTAAFTVADGAMIGFDIPAMIRQVQRGQIPQVALNAAEKTDFSELSGTFAITGGVARSQDLKLLSPAVRVSGGGQFELGRRQMDVRLKPKLTVAAMQSGGGGLAAIGEEIAKLDVPIVIRGPWDQPRVTVDLDGVVKDNQQIKKGIDQIGEVLKSKEGKEAVKEIGKTLRNLLGR